MCSDSYPLKPPDWRSVLELMRDHSGSWSRIHRKLTRLRDDLIGDIAATGIGEEEAAAIVERFLIGERLVKVSRQGRPYSSTRLVGSPDAIRLLDVPKKRECPDLPEDWRSVSSLIAERGLDRTSVRFRAAELQEDLRHDLVAAGIEDEQAGRLVESHLIGTCRLPNGHVALAFSPQGLLIAESASVLDKRPPGRPKGNGRDRGRYFRGSGLT